MRTPETWSVRDAPEEITVYEVGARDGLQNEQTVVPVEVKAEFIERLVDAGARAVELTSFVRGDLVPRMGDAEQLMARLSLPADVRSVALTPNLRGVQRALECGIREVAIFASATETFSQRNLNCSIDESLARFEPVVALARANGVAVRAYVSMCWGDPWEGVVPLEAVVRVGCRMMDLGASELSLGDTIGVATPGHVVALLDAFGAAGVARDRLAVHFHDTYGQALANAAAAIGAGVRIVDTSAGGLGGCPFAKSASGNLATEDLLWHLHGQGVRTGIDLAALVETSEWLAAHLGRPSPSRVVQALTR
ncbi:MAG TPA: hydroxymethylglutaryl-CoA lyase [Acidimicrobiales bacterium]|nr:hydroxymethylglutaryl-CoA lyase [Acidimicrobiales bacterium]